MADLPQTRQSLLVRLSKNSGDAWSEFLEVYQQAIYEFARRRGLQDADAWDVTQEVLAAVEKKVETWNSDPTQGKFRGWLFRVARNIAVDKIVDQSRRAAASGDSRVAQLLAELPETQDQQTSIFWLEYRKTLMSWAAERIRPDFKDSSWRSFLMTAVEGRKPEEVAAELKLTVGSVYAAKFRIVTRIRKLVARFDDGEQVEDDTLRSIVPRS
ncbi:MAG: RNA polymerase sigma factor (sigma-70 family) [Mariniblastus sp.]|jgi:RNA polymerase sigma factor (sigma-70 family)